LMAQKAVSGRRAARRYALSGLLRCGKCGTRLYSAARGDRRRYVCLSGPDHGGCGKLTVVAEPVEELIARAVLFRLDTPELADALAGRTAQDDALAAVVHQLGQDREQLDELADAYATRSITMREWLAARKPIEDRISRAERRLARANDTDALPSLIGNGQALGRAWDSLNLDRQVAIITALLDHAVIGAGATRSPHPGPVAGATGLEAVSHRCGQRLRRREPRSLRLQRASHPPPAHPDRRPTAPRPVRPAPDQPPSPAPPAPHRTPESIPPPPPPRRSERQACQAHCAQTAGPPCQSSTSADDHRRIGSAPTRAETSSITAFGLRPVIRCTRG
jgi:Recombinase zinc beta ribbon domain